MWGFRQGCWIRRFVSCVLEKSPRPWRNASGLGEDSIIVSFIDSFLFSLLAMIFSRPPSGGLGSLVVHDRGDSPYSWAAHENDVATAVAIVD